MDTQNSLTDFYVGIIFACYRDVTSAAQVTRVERERDLARMHDRISAEGLSFLTKTLPRMGKAIDLALNPERRLQWPYTKKRRDTEIPVLFGGLLSLVFDSSGHVRSDACVVALEGLRQLCFLFKKLELPYTASIVTETVDRFAEVDRQCGLDIDHMDPLSLTLLDRAKRIIRYVTQDLDLVNIHPRHGSGSVSTGQRQWEKPHFDRIIEKLDRKYPYMDYFCFNYSHGSDALDKILKLPYVDSGVAKLVPVPKDSRGPRLISAEPLENQWIQQGQMQNIVRLLESHHLTRGQVNFTDQTINGALALEGSKAGEWATLDMKEASDRVSVDLVKYLFHEYHYEFLDASRSTHTELPDGSLIRLKKFAPMGSAVCFPVEALVFWALSVSSLISKHNLSLTHAAKSVYVYGDDIICRSDHHATIRHTLPQFGLMLNEEKCCTAGSFRESCGVDAFKGVNVTPVKISGVWSSLLTPESTVSYVAYSNAFYAKQYFETAHYIESEILKRIKIPYCQTSEFGGIAFVRAGDDTVSRNRRLSVRTRYNTDLNRHETLAPSLVTRTHVRKPSKWEDLLYWWTSRTPLGRLFCPKQYEACDTFADQLALLKSQAYDRAVSSETQKLALNPISRPPVGVYAVRHRNRLQWRWCRSDN